MTFVPRRLEHGGVCCSHAGALCPDCEKHFGRVKLGQYPRAAASMPESGYDSTLRYAEATSIPPSIDPNYQPFGTPPDSYRIALAYRQAQEAEGLEAPVIPRHKAPRAVHYDRLNPPDPYAAGLAALREQE
jgi:hypothetical protein